MNPIYILWATPRSTSTAFEWMMRMRGDMACFQEPFGGAWHHDFLPHYQYLHSHRLLP